jgi:peptidyl-prolyl cis-trans isomerase-like protein 2
MLIFTNGPTFERKSEGLNPLRITPFDSCALTFQPFETPVCARNADGTGTVFELTSIIPWLK